MPGFRLACRSAALAQGPVRISLDEAIQLALQHNHTLLAARTTILAEPGGGDDGEPASRIPRCLVTPSISRRRHPTTDYLNNASEFDIGISYLFERGKKRQRRLQAAKDITAQTRSLVADNERSLTFNVATQFVNAQLAESTLELAEQDLKSFQQTVDVGEIRFKAGAISEDDYLKIKLQLLQFETDFQQSQLAKVQALSDLRQLLGYESVSADYDVAGQFDYQPVKGNVEDMQLKALQNRPDLRAAQQGVTVAKSQYELQKAIAKVDITGQVNYTHVSGLNTASFFGNIPLTDFRSQPGRDCARNLRHHAGAGAAEGGKRASHDRCTRRLSRSADERQGSHPLSVRLSRRGAEGPGHQPIRVSARRRQLTGFSRRRAQLSCHPAGLSASAGRVLAGGRTASRSGGRERSAVTGDRVMNGEGVKAERMSRERARSERVEHAFRPA